MTASPPPDPSSRRPLGFDDMIGVLVAFLSIGAILFWALGRRTPTFDLLGSSAPADQAAAPVSDTLVESLFGIDSAADEDRSPPAVVAPAPGRTPPGNLFVDPTNPTRVESFVPGTVSPTPVGPTAVVPVPAPDAEPTASPSPAASPTPDQAITFTDVPNTYWAYPFIQALAQRGIVRGFADGTFKPDQPVNRAEFASLLSAAFADRQAQRQPENFGDIPSGFWATPAINKAYSTGFMEGYPGDVFRPAQEIPKVQAVVALASGLEPSDPANTDQVLQRYRDAAQIPEWARGQVAAATETGLVVNHPDPAVLEPARNATRAEVSALIYQALVEAGQAEPIESQYIVNP